GDAVDVLDLLRRAAALRHLLEGAVGTPHAVDERGVPKVVVEDPGELPGAGRRPGRARDQPAVEVAVVEDDGGQQVGDRLFVRDVGPVVPAAPEYVAGVVLDRVGEEPGAGRRAVAVG